VCEYKGSSSVKREKVGEFEEEPHQKKEQVGRYRVRTWVYSLPRTKSRSL
jgi:hypothetical protein